MASQLDNLRAKYDSLTTLAEKKNFITSLSEQMQKQGVSSPAYKKFLSECIRKHNAEATGKSVKEFSSVKSSASGVKGFLKNSLSSVGAALSNVADTAKEKATEINESAKVKQSPQYQTYLHVLHVLNSCGYETILHEDENKLVRHFVNRDAINYGAVYVVADKGMGGFFGETELGRAINEGSAHKRMWEACNIVETHVERKLFHEEGFNIRDYVCRHEEYGGVGGHVSIQEEAFANNEWIPIFKTALQRK